MDVNANSEMILVCIAGHIRVRRKCKGNPVVRLIYSELLNFCCVRLIYCVDFGKFMTMAIPDPLGLLLSESCNRKKSDNI